jgi:hypothetical protein
MSAGIDRQEQEEAEPPSRGADERAQRASCRGVERRKASTRIEYLPFSHAHLLAGPKNGLWHCPSFAWSWCVILYIYIVVGGRRRRRRRTACALSTLSLSANGLSKFKLVSVLSDKYEREGLLS